MAEAPDKSLEGLFKDYQTRRNLELRRGFSRAMAGRSGDPNIMKIVAERTRDLSPADRAAMKTETLKSLKELESLRTRGFTEGGAKDTPLLDSAREMMMKGAELYAEGETEKLKGLIERRGKLEDGLAAGSPGVIPEAAWETYYNGPEKAHTSFRNAVNHVEKVWTGSGSGTAFQDALYDALIAPTVGAGRVSAFLAALAAKAGGEGGDFTIHDILKASEEGDVHKAQVIKGLAATGEEKQREGTAAAERVETEILSVEAEIKGITLGMSKEGRDFYNNIFGAYNKILRGEGDPAELDRLGELLGIGPGKFAEPRDMTAEEQQIHDELMDTLEYLEKGTPESRELREAIFEDQRFKAWMESQGYSNPEQAFKVWLKEAKTSARRSGARTRRQHLVNVASGATAGGPLKFAAGTAISSRDERAEALKRSWGEGSIFKDAPTRSVWEVRRAEALREGMREPAPVSRTEILDPVETERTKRRKARTAKLEERAGVRREEKRKAEVAAEDAERAAARKAAEEAASDSLTAGEGRTKPRSKRRF